MTWRRGRGDRLAGAIPPTTAPLAVVGVAGAPGERVDWGDKQERRERLLGHLARRHEPIPILATLPPPRRTIGRMQVLVAAVVIVSIAMAAVLLIVLELGRGADERLRLADAERLDVPEAAHLSSLIAIEPSPFAGLQTPPVLPMVGPAVDPQPAMESPAPGAATLVTGAGAGVTVELPAPPAPSESTAGRHRAEPSAPAPSASASFAPAPSAPAPSAALPPPPASGVPDAPVGPVDPNLLMARGTAFLDRADVSSARLFFRLAAEQGSAAGAMAMAATYDPRALTGTEMHGMRPDAKAAVAWYRRAAALGDTGAEGRAKGLIEELDRRAAGGDTQARAMLEAIGR